MVRRFSGFAKGRKKSEDSLLHRLIAQIDPRADHHSVIAAPDIPLLWRQDGQSGKIKRNDLGFLPFFAFPCAT
jgi:hypothetical protein